jgi:hypothetical protein
MAGKRIGLATAAALMAASLTVGGASAAAATETTVTRGIVLDIVSFASQTCGFLIELHTVGMEVAISHYDADGILRSQTIVQQYNGYLLNPANGKTVSSRVAGPVHDVYLDDGSIYETGSGATTRTAPGSGLVSGFIGHSSVTLVPTGETDEDGFPVYDFVDETSTGIFLGNQGVCDVLD